MKLRNLAIIATLTLIVALAAPLQAAETVHLYLKVNGLDVKGESTQESLGRRDSIECVYYEHSIECGPSLAGVTRTEPRYNPIKIRKRIDKASPVLIRAISQGEKVDGTFKFFRPNPTGDGTTEQFYTVEIRGGRIESVKQYVPDTILPATSSDPPMEEITISYSTITFSYPSSGGSSSATTRPRA